jgi:SAM-dependent methyltransferase
MQQIGDHREAWRNQMIHVDQFRGEASAGYLATVGAALEGELASLPDARILDFGCWSGATSLLMAHLLNVDSVAGTDIDTASIEFAQRFIQPLSEKLSFARGEATALPFPAGSFDLIAINQVFCNMHREQYDAVVAELSRVLSARGRILLIDSNNPDNPAARKRLQELNATMENPESGLLMLARERFFEGRDKALPARELALRTCYMNRAQLDEALARYKASGELPDSRFEPTSLRVPRALGIGAVSSPTEPRYFVDEFGKHAVECVVGTSYPVHRSLTREELAQSGTFYLVGSRRRSG